MNLIGSVLRYDSEAWTLSQTVEKMLDAFERNLLRRIYGPVLIKDSSETDIITKFINYTRKWNCPEISD